ncbi:MAG: divalent-cation tolerance protein CutA [Terriglobales bacterium]|jgi:periplasmic divalent cation tolerance protein
MSDYMTDKIIALTTCGSAAEARKIAHNLVDRRLAACVNIVPGIESIYRWKGKVETAAEFLLIIKTTKDASPGLRAAVSELHSYEIPEYLEIPIADGSQAYLHWIEQWVKIN